MLIIIVIGPISISKPSDGFLEGLLLSGSQLLLVAGAGHNNIYKIVGNIYVGKVLNRGEAKKRLM